METNQLPPFATLYPVRTFRGHAQRNGDGLRLTPYAGTGKLELNESAAIIFHLCDGECSVSEIVQTIREECDAPSSDAVATDVYDCLSELADRSLVKLCRSRSSCVPIVRVRFEDFWPDFDPENNCFTRLLTSQSCVVLAAGDTADLLFTSTYGRGAVRNDSGVSRSKRIFVSDRSDEPDLDAFDFAFSSAEVDGEYRSRHFHVPDPAALRSRDHHFEPELARRFQLALFPPDLEHALELCREGLAVSPDDAGLLSTQATLIGRLHGWSASRPNWEDYWYRSTKGTLSWRNGGTRLPSPPPYREFDKLTPGDAIDEERHRHRVCVYTALFGDYDVLSPVIRHDSRVDYICFTDQDIQVPGWTVVLSQPKHADAVLCAKEFKVLPHKYLRDYDASLYIDASTFVYDDLSPLVNRFLVGQSFVMYLHPDRVDPFEDAEAVLSGLRHTPEPILRQMEKYESERLPPGAGLFEASFMWRDHRDPDVVELMELWWRQIVEFSTRDQLSLSYLVWKTGVAPKVFSNEFGTSRINPYLFRKPHNTIAKPRFKLPRKTRLCFLFDRRHRDVASSRMRGEQLAALVNDYGGGSITACYVDDATVSGSIVILTKGMLKEITVSALMEVRRNNVLVAADYVDSRPRPELHDGIDVYIASSIKGYYRMCHKFVDKQVFMVTHNLDRRLGEPNSGERRFNAGYFGELDNALHSDCLRDVVDFHSINTRDSSTDWLSRVGEYSLHYAVRRRRHFDGDKPFLKGFIAAHHGANILTARGDGDAMHYLPPDYPYFVNGESEGEIRRALEHAKGSFGGPQWHYGLRAMQSVRERSSNDRVYRDIETMIRQLRE